MKLNNKIIALLALCFTTPIYANLNVVSVKDTFTYENAAYTMAGDSTRTYIITSDNGVKAKGTSLFGVGDALITSTEWVDVVEDRSGIPIGDIVKINSNMGSRSINITMINKNGELYNLTEASKYPYKLNADKPIVNSKTLVTRATNKANSGAWIFALTDDGSLYEYSGAGEKTADDPIIHQVDEPIIDFALPPGTGGNTNPVYGILLGESGTIYILKVDPQNSKTTISKTNIKNAVKVYDGGNNEDNKTMFIKFSDGSVKYYDASIDTITNITFSDPSIQVLDVMTGLYQTPMLYTTDGMYVVTLNKYNANSVTKMNIDKQVVDNAGGNVLCTDGKYYKMNLTGTEYTLTPFEDTDKVSLWANENPIVPNRELAKFNIETNTIFKRNTNYPIEFSLVTKSLPTAFNIYYAKAGDLENKILIESNVSYGSLNPTDYITGYVDANGSEINGKTYTYNWRIGDEDLTRIHLIIEPIY